jgi:diguanylate cyclase (GGDEF)-like protein
MSWAVQAQRAWQVRTSEEIARAWIGRMVERTPLAELDELAIGWLGREAPVLVGELLDELNSGPLAPGPLPAATAERARALTAMRSPTRAAAEVPRDLALLQSLLAEALARNSGDGVDADPREEHLVTLFGELQSEFTQALLHERLAAEGRDVVTGGHDERALRAEIERLLEAGGRGAGPFAVLELDVDGLRHLNSAAGADAGDRVIRAVADAARDAVGGPIYRREGDELIALVPGSEGPAAAALAAGVREGVARALGEDPLRSPLSIGVAAWPAHAADPDQLLERAREATYIAKSSGHGVALANGAAPLQRS